MFLDFVLQVRLEQKLEAKNSNEENEKKRRKRKRENEISALVRSGRTCCKSVTLLYCVLENG